MRYVGMMISTGLMLGTIALAVVAAPANAITYVVDRNIAGGTVSGTITTDDTIGVLLNPNITAFSLTLNDRVNSFVLTEANGFFTNLGSALTATSTGIFFDFGATGSHYSVFRTGAAFAPMWCVQTVLCFNPRGPNEGLRVTPDGDLLEQARQGNVQIATAIPGGGNGGVPEPAAWAMMLAGFGALGFVLRRRPKVNARIRYT